MSRIESVSTMHGRAWYALQRHRLPSALGGCSQVSSSRYFLVPLRSTAAGVEQPHPPDDSPAPVASSQLPQDPRRVSLQGETKERFRQSDPSARRSWRGLRRPIPRSNPWPATPSPDPINAALSRLAVEATREVNRIAAVGGFDDENTRRTAFNILDTLRGVVWQQSQRMDSFRFGTDSAQRQAERVRLNDSIVSAAASAKRNIDQAGKRIQAIRTILSEVLSYYHRVLKNENLINTYHLATMMNKIGFLAVKSDHLEWVLNLHWRIIHDILSSAVRMKAELTPSGLALLIYSVGRLGPSARVKTVDGKPFDAVFEELLLEVEVHGPEMVPLDLVHVVSGCSRLRASEMVVAPFIASFAQLLTSKMQQFNPNQMRELAFSFCHIYSFDSRKLLSSLLDAATAKLSAFDDFEIAAFLRSWITLIHRLPHMAPKLQQKAVEVLEERLDDISLDNLLEAVEALVLLSYHPSDFILNKIYSRMEEAFERDAVSVRQLLMLTTICMNLDVHPESLLRSCKRYFVENYAQFSFQSVVKLIWALSLLGEVDAPILETLPKTPLLRTTPKMMTNNLGRRLNLALGSLRVLHNVDTSQIVSRETEEMCYAGWRGSLKAGNVRDIPGEALEILAPSGFNCRPHWVIENVPMMVTTVVLPASVSGHHNDLQFAVEISAPRHVFHNKPELLVPESRMRRKFLEAQGWTVLDLARDEWFKLENPKAKAQYLYNRIKEKTGFEFDRLLNFDAERTKDAKQAKAALEADGTADSTAFSDQVSQKEQDNKATLADEDLAPRASMIDDDKFSDLVRKDTEVPQASQEEHTAGVDEQDEEAVPETVAEEEVLDAEAEAEATQPEDEIADTFSVSESDEEESDAVIAEDSEPTLSESDKEESEWVTMDDSDPASSEESDDLSDLERVEESEEFHSESEIPNGPSSAAEVTPGEFPEDVGLFISDADLESLMDDEDSSAQRGRQSRATHDVSPQLKE